MSKACASGLRGALRLSASTLGAVLAAARKFRGQPLVTNGKTCIGSSMANGCKCAEVTLRAKDVGDGTAGCCGGSQPDSMIVASSAW